MGASPARRPTCVPCRRRIGYPRVLEFLNIDATNDISFPLNCSNFGSSSLFGEISKRRSSMSICCSDDNMLPSS
jgi:hypothetical protein